ncbi:MAG: hypothetical protein WA880_15520 [Ornithinimicrobium sp.]
MSTAIAEEALASNAQERFGATVLGAALIGPLTWAMWVWPFSPDHGHRSW